jgi:hypothetical protein
MASSSAPISPVICLCVTVPTMRAISAHSVSGAGSPARKKKSGAMVT